MTAESTCARPGCHPEHVTVQGTVALPSTRSERREASRSDERRSRRSRRIPSGVCHPERRPQAGVEGSRAVIAESASRCRRTGSFDFGLRPSLRMTCPAQGPSTPAASPLIASRCLPALASRARECNGPLDCCMLRMATWPEVCQCWLSSGTGRSWRFLTLVDHLTTEKPAFGFLVVPLTRQNGEVRN